MKTIKIDLDDARMTVYFLKERYMNWKNVGVNGFDLSILAALITRIDVKIYEVENEAT